MKQCIYIFIIILFSNTLFAQEFLFQKKYYVGDKKSNWTNQSNYIADIEYNSKGIFLIINHRYSMSIGNDIEDNYHLFRIDPFTYELQNKNQIKGKTALVYPKFYFHQNEFELISFNCKSKIMSYDYTDCNAAYYKIDYDGNILFENNDTSLFKVYIEDRLFLLNNTINYFPVSLTKIINQKLDKENFSKISQDTLYNVALDTARLTDTLSIKKISNCMIYNDSMMIMSLNFYQDTYHQTNLIALYNMNTKVTTILEYKGLFTGYMYNYEMIQNERYIVLNYNKYLVVFDKSDMMNYKTYEFKSYNNDIVFTMNSSAFLRPNLLTVVGKYKYNLKQYNIIQTVDLETGEHTRYFEDSIDIFTEYALYTTNYKDTILIAYHNVPNRDTICVDFYTSQYSSVNDKPTNELKIFPNPSNSFVDLDCGDNFVNTEIYIYNIYGQQVLFQTKNNDRYTRIDTSTLLPGIYYIRMGNQTRKFVKI